MNTKIVSFLGLIAIFISFSCEREYNNPYDEKANLSPTDWAPQNLQIEDISITEKKLTWTCNEENIEGFKLDRKKGDDDWQTAYKTVSKETRSWTDTNIIPAPDLTYSYRLYAFAGQYNSAQDVFYSSAVIPAPSNLKTEKLTDKSYKLLVEYIDERIYRRIFFYPVGCPDSPTIDPHVIGAFWGDYIIFEYPIEGASIGFLEYSGETLRRSLQTIVEKVKMNRHYLGIAVACISSIETLGESVYIIQEELKKAFGEAPFLLLYMAGEDVKYPNSPTLHMNYSFNMLTLG